MFASIFIPPKYKRVGLVLLFFVLFPIISLFAQKREVLDSLVRAYQTATHDTTKVLILRSLAITYRDNKTDSAAFFAKEALKYAEKIKYDYGIARCLNVLGSLAFYQTRYTEAIECQEKAILYYTKIKDIGGLATSYNSLGTIFDEQTNYPKALEMYYKAIRYEEERNNFKGMGICLNNIAIVYREQENYTKAFKTFEEAAEMNKKAKDSVGIGVAYNNIAELLMDRKNYEDAEKYLFESLAFKKNSQNKRSIANTIENIGSNYVQKGEIEKGLEYHFEALKIREEINDLRGIAQSQSDIAQAYYLQKKYVQAIEYGEKAYNFAQAKKTYNLIEESADILHNAYKGQGNYVKALEYYELSVVAKDSLNSAARNKQLLGLQSDYEVDKKKKELTLLEKEQRLTKEEARSQKLYSYLLGSGLLLLCAVAFFLVMSNRQKQRANTLLKEQKEEIIKQKEDIEYKNKELHKAYSEIDVQNEELKQQQEEILTINENLEKVYKELANTTERLNDSIRYAKNIQAAVLPDEDEINSFFQDCFVIFSPKDIVSGDFYWLQRIDERRAIFALADCTGHGVPGAFMTMICHTLLHEAVNIREITEPALILQNVHLSIKDALNQHSGKNKDGMDVALALFEKDDHHQKTTITFAGAKSQIIVAQQEELLILKGDRVFIGGIFSKEAHFADQCVKVDVGTMVYFATDGFIDQHNRERKKIGSTQFQELLFSISKESPESQKEILLGFLSDFQRDTEQRDDISVIGLKM